MTTNTDTLNYYYDTEFIEYPNTIELISIGIVCEDGREYYAISSDYNYNKASDWVRENVIHPLYGETVHGDARNSMTYKNFNKFYGKSIETIRNEILRFVNGTTPNLHGYYSAYDHVVFCWIFGTMVQLPEQFPMYTIDLQQTIDELGLDESKFPKNENLHNALSDARWTRYLHQHILKEKESIYFQR